VGFGEEIGDFDKWIIVANPYNLEVFKCDTITNPMISHVHGFGSFLATRFHCNSGGSFVICVHGCCWLDAIEVIESGSQMHGLLSADEYTSVFCFRGG
jgi:hypothetical protein